FKTESATFFFSEAIRVHGKDQILTFREIAILIDELGDDWYAEFRKAKKERIDRGKFHYVNILGSNAQPQHFEYYAKSLKLYAEVKASNFEKIASIDNPDEIAAFCSVLTTGDYKNLTVAH